MISISYVIGNKIYTSICRLHPHYQNLVIVKVVRWRKNRGNAFTVLRKERLYKQMH